MYRRVRLPADGDGGIGVAGIHRGSQSPDGAFRTEAMTGLQGDHMVREPRGR